MKEIIFYTKNRKIIILSFIISISTGSAILIQFLKGWIFDSASKGNQNKALTQLILFLVLIFVEVAFYYIEWQYENHIISDFFNNIKIKIMSNVLNFNNRSNPLDVKEATHIITNSVNSLEFTYYNAWFDNIYLSFRVIFVFLSLIYINFIIACILLLLLLLPLVITKFFKKKISARNNLYLEQLGKNMKKYENLIFNLNNVHIFNLRSFFLNTLRKNISTEKSYRINLKSYQNALNFFYSLISYISSFIIIAFSMDQILKSKMTIGVAITLLGLVEQMSLPILSLSRNFSNISSTVDVRKQIDQMATNIGTPKPQISFNSKIDTNNLKVSFSDHLITYKNLHFVRGESYLIRGTSGIGKSVFLDIVTGLKKYQTGSVRYDEKELGNQAKMNTFSDIAYITADNSLFATTVLENIFFERKPTDSELNICKRLLSVKILNSETVNNLSTGEKRRILLLRGLMAQKETLIFDEPTANLDKNNARLFWKLLWDWKQKEQKRTLIVVTHEVDLEDLDHFTDHIVFKN